MPVEASHLVDEVMRRWPVTIRVFVEHRTRCVGCPIACFHTVADACREHGLPEEAFLAALRARAAAQSGAHGTWSRDRSGSGR